jgi:hypothetical protein
VAAAMCRLLWWMLRGLLAHLRCIWLPPGAEPLLLLLLPPGAEPLLLPSGAEPLLLPPGAEPLLLPSGAGIWPCAGGCR